MKGKFNHGPMFDDSASREVNELVKNGLKMTFNDLISDMFCINKLIFKL